MYSHDGHVDASSASKLNCVETLQGSIYCILNLKGGLTDLSSSVNQPKVPVLFDAYIFN